MRSVRTASFVLFAFALCAPSARIIAQATTIPLNSQATYLLTYADPEAWDAPPIDLSRLGLNPGDTITLQLTGDFCYTPYTPGGCAGNEFGPGQTAAVFSSTNTLLSADQLNRVPGAVASNGPPVNTEVTYYGSLSTDIPQDFQIGSGGAPASTVVTIPPGAQFLFVAVVDSYYGDNSDPNRDLAITIGKGAQSLQVPTTFSSFSASLELSGGTAPAFGVSGEFRLGAGSDGINPVTEPVAFQVGSFLAIVPPASFARNSDGSFAFAGVVSGVSLRIRIRPIDNGGFSFHAQGSGTNLAWRELAGADPVSVGLGIGNDTGVTPLSADE